MQRLIFNQITPAKEQSFLPFALTDIFTEFVHSNHIEIIHFWQLENTFILGMKDTRTPFVEKGIKKIIEHSYVPVIRNSGGLGVIADEGILILVTCSQKQQIVPLPITHMKKWFP